MTSGAPDVPQAAGPATTVQLDYPRADIRLLATSEMERKVRARACRKEPWTVDWIEAGLGQGGVFYDIGANVGVYSLVAARQPVPPRVFAFEPGYRNFANLCDNVHLNECAAWVTPVPLALGGRSALGRFRYHSLDAGQSGHRLLGADAAWRGVMQELPVVALDDLVRLCGLPPPTHLKLDVDGCELEVLHGAAATLRAPTLRSLLLEVDEAVWAPVLDEVGRAGYTLRTRHQRKPTSPHYLIFDRR